MSLPPLGKRRDVLVAERAPVRFAWLARREARASLTMAAEEFLMNCFIAARAAPVVVPCVALHQQVLREVWDGDDLAAARA